MGEDEKINPDLIKKSGLCLACLHDDDPSQEILCTLTWVDQDGEGKFECHEYKHRG